MDSLGLNRASLHKTLPKALALAERAAESASSGQNELFGLGSSTPKAEERIESEYVDEWPIREKLSHERETLGFYLSGHPIEAYADVIAQICSGRMRELIDAIPPPLPPAPDGKKQWQTRSKQMFAAWVTDLRFFKGDKDDKSGRASYKVTLNDQGSLISTWIDADKWLKYQPFVRVDQLVFVIAEFGMSVAKEGRESEPRLYNPDFLEPGALMADYATRITLDWKRMAQDVAQLHKALGPYRVPQGAPVTVHYVNGKAAATLEWSPEWRLRVQDECLAALHQFLGATCVKVQFRRYTPPASERRFERPSSGGHDDE
jgi:DNA polymerase-3 subunit alpha